MAHAIEDTPSETKEKNPKLMERKRAKVRQLKRATRSCQWSTPTCRISITFLSLSLSLCSPHKFYYKSATAWCGSRYHKHPFNFSSPLPFALGEEFIKRVGGQYQISRQRVIKRTNAKIQVTYTVYRKNVYGMDRVN